jgi:hypothetical protein
MKRKMADFASNGIQTVVGTAAVGLVVAYYAPPSRRLLAGVLTALLATFAAFSPYGGSVALAAGVAAGTWAVLQQILPDNRDPTTAAAGSGRSDFKVTTPIFEGTINAAVNQNKRYSTSNPLKDYFRNLPASSNRGGGAEFSYSLWVMFEKGATDADLQGATLFMRGIDKKFAWIEKSSAGDESKSAEYAITCPRVSFDTARRIRVDVNTNERIQNVLLFGAEEARRPYRRNILSLLPGHFVMLTFTFKDHFDRLRAEPRGFSVSMFVNNELYDTKWGQGSLRVPDAPLIVLPQSDGKTIKDCTLADLTYYNWALSAADVFAAHAKGHSTSPAQDVNLRRDLKLTGYNTNDLYNFGG